MKIEWKRLAIVSSIGAAALGVLLGKTLLEAEQFKKDHDDMNNAIRGIVDCKKCQLCLRTGAALHLIDHMQTVHQYSRAIAIKATHEAFNRFNARRAK